MTVIANPLETVEAFHSKTLKTWNHRDHAIICLYYAMRAKSDWDLMAHIRCAFIQFRTLTNPEFKIEKCVEKWHETKTWFWCQKFFTLVEDNKDKSFDELVHLAHELGYMNTTYILEFYTQSTLDSVAARATIVASKKL